MPHTRTVTSVIPLFEPHAKHQGKALVKLNSQEDKLELIFDCVTCGRFTVEISLSHVGIVSNLLQEICDRYGITTDVKQEVVDRLETSDPAEAQELIDKYESLPADKANDLSKTPSPITADTSDWD